MQGFSINSSVQCDPRPPNGRGLPAARQRGSRDTSRQSNMADVKLMKWRERE